MSGTSTPLHSHIGFSVRHAAIARVRGVFTDITATAIIDQDINQSEIDVAIQVASIDTQIEARDKHLRSEDFFNVKKYPTMTFVSTSFNLDGEDLTLVGDLTLRGVTKSVELKGTFNGVVDDHMDTTRFGASLTGEISRKDFGVYWNAPLVSGGFAVGDTISLNLEVEFTAPEAH